MKSSYHFQEPLYTAGQKNFINDLLVFGGIPMHENFICKAETGAVRREDAHPDLSGHRIQHHAHFPRLPLGPVVGLVVQVGVRYSILRGDTRQPTGTSASH